MCLEFFGRNFPHVVTIVLPNSFNASDHLSDITEVKHMRVKDYQLLYFWASFDLWWQNFDSCLYVSNFIFSAYVESLHVLYSLFVGSFWYIWTYLRKCSLLCWEYDWHFDILKLQFCIALYLIMLSDFCSIAVQTFFRCKPCLLMRQWRDTMTSAELNEPLVVQESFNSLVVSI